MVKRKSRRRKPYHHGGTKLRKVKSGSLKGKRYYYWGGKKSWVDRKKDIRIKAKHTRSKKGHPRRGDEKGKRY